MVLCLLQRVVPQLQNLLTLVDQHMILDHLVWVFLLEQNLLLYLTGLFHCKVAAVSRYKPYIKIEINNLKNWTMKEVCFKLPPFPFVLMTNNLSQRGGCWDLLQRQTNNSEIYNWIDPLCRDQFAQCRNQTGVRIKLETVYTHVLSWMIACTWNGLT